MNDQHFDNIPNHYTVEDEDGKFEINPPEVTFSHRDPHTFDEISRREVCLEYGYDMDEDEASTLWAMDHSDWEDELLTDEAKAEIKQTSKEELLRKLEEMEKDQDALPELNGLLPI